jgi:hypothetical protein
MRQMLLQIDRQEVDSYLCRRMTVNLVGVIEICAHKPTKWK